MHSKILQVARGSLARNASWMFLGQSANLGLQVACFILVARFLGVAEYGVFSGALALTYTVMPYSSLGAGTLFMRYVSVQRETAPVYWGNALGTTVAMTAILTTVLCVPGP